MKLIAHRGNTHGPKPELENSPNYILDAFTRHHSLEIEIDVWYLANQDNEFNMPWGWYLGHDKPTYKITEHFLHLPNFWLHCKNVGALQKLQSTSLNYFWHHADRCALTSHQYIWTCDSSIGSNRTIWMVPDVRVNEVTMWKGKFDGCCNDWILDPIPVSRTNSWPTRDDE